MYPVIMPNDQLKIEPLSIQNIQIGDIAVFRHKGFLYCHRVVKKGTLTDRSFIITVADRNKETQDQPTFADDFFGRVSKIKRGVKDYPVSSQHPASPASRYFPLKLLFINAKIRLARGLTQLVQFIGNLYVYELFIRSVLCIWMPEKSYFVQIPLNETLGDFVYYRLPWSEFSPDKIINNKTIKRCRLVLHLNEEKGPAAWVSLERKDSTTWIATNFCNRLRYSGAGFENDLLKLFKSSTVFYVECPEL